MAFKKGKSGNPKGRPKGAEGKVTSAFKQALLRVYDRMGGDEQLLAWATENQTEFYKIAARLIPTEVTADVDGVIEVRWKS